MEKNYKDLMDARDFINGLTYDTVQTIILDRNKVVYDNGIIDDFMNYCRGIDIWDFTSSNFYKLRNIWVMTLSSAILNAFSNEIENN